MLCMLVAITGRPGAASLAGVLHAVHAMDTGVKGPIGLIGGIGASAHRRILLTSSMLRVRLPH